MKVNKQIFNKFIRKPVAELVQPDDGPQWEIIEMKWVKFRPASAKEIEEDGRTLRRMKPTLRVLFNGINAKGKPLKITVQHRDGDWRFNLVEPNGKDSSGGKGMDTFFTITLPQRVRNNDFVVNVMVAVVIMLNEVEL